MNIKNIFADEDAVSPVIGVILMVAITVILAAVIGAFVLGIGGSQEKVPSASFSFDTSPSSGSGACEVSTSVDSSLTISHDGGGEISGSNLYVNAGNEQQWDGAACSGDSEVNAGKTLTVDYDSDNDVNVIWKSPSSDDTSILATFEA